MKENKKRSLGFGLVAIATAMAMLASTAGSLAWYAYSRSVRFSFIGTSVAQSALLNVGLVDNEGYFSDDDLVEFELTKERHDDNWICFSNSRSGLSVKAIQKYLFNSNHAVSRLFPVTTQARSLLDQSDLQLYKAPEAAETQFTIGAKDTDYSVLPFAFKIINEDAQYVEGKQVWLTESVCKAELNMEKAVRVFVEGTNKKFLMRPADQQNDTGKTKVGGLLDLDGDGAYDYDKSSMLEYCYGQFDGTPSHSSTPYPDDPEHDVCVDVNGTGDSDEQSTFYAKHYPNSYIGDYSSAPPLEAEYYCFGAVKPNMRENGQYYVGDSGIPIASTSSGSKIGYATFTIFIEGWDHALIDKVEGLSFNLGLRFEIDRT